MLTLTDSFRVEGHSIFRDIQKLGERWVATARVYALPDRPHFARDADGKLMFNLLRYRGGVGTAGPRGGVMALSVELGVAPDMKLVIEDAIAQTLQLGANAKVELAPLPVVGGTVALAFAGESGEADFVRALGGNGLARLTGRERASFIVDLSEDAASLLGNALDSGVDLLHARYDLDVLHALGDVIVRVWCDARRSHEALGARLAAGPMTPDDMRTVLRDARLAGSEIEVSRSIPDDERKRLDEIAANLLEQVLAEALFAVRDGTSGAGLKTRNGTAQLRPFDDGLSVLVNRRITQSYPAVGHVVAEDVMALAPYKQEIAQQIQSIDLEGHASRVLDVLIQCTVNFAEDLIERVKATVHLADARPGDAPREFVFDGGMVTARYRTDLPADASRRYRIEALVFFRRDPKPFPVVYPESEAAIAVLDLDGVGSLSVQVSLGDVPFERVRQVAVELTHPPSGAATRMILGADRLSEQWQIVTRDSPRSYRRRAVWLMDDDSRIEGPWEESAAGRWVLNAPAALRDYREIVLVAGGSFANVAQAVVELRDGSAGATARFVFTAPDQSHRWQRRAADAGGSYELREIVVDRDGRVSESPWRTDDSPVVVVRDRTSFTVRIVPRLLPIGADHPLALVALEPVEDADAGRRTTLTLRDQQETSWTFRIGGHGRHRYRHQVTLVSRAGVRRASDWQEMDSELLVLRPPG